MKRGRPTLALGGGARKDHLFEDKRSLCGSYMWGGGYEVEATDEELAQAVEDGDLCTRCARSHGVDV